MHARPLASTAWHSLLWQQKGMLCPEIDFRFGASCQCCAVGWQANRTGVAAAGSYIPHVLHGLCCLLYVCSLPF